MSAIFITRGFSRYVGGLIEETNGEDITTTGFSLAVATSGTIPPDHSAFDTVGMVSTVGATPSQRHLSKLIDSTFALPAGKYYLWAAIADNPEKEPKMLQGFTTA